MRVITGSARGKKLFAPEGLGTRPTTDRVKESMFNIISYHLPAEKVLDLFAGSGALGIEALSRGCSHAVFVENNARAFAAAGQNLASAHLSERAVLMRTDAVSYLERTSEVFDLVFLDPPYNTGLLTKAVLLLNERKLITRGGIIAAESEAGGEEPPECGFELIRRAKYGKTTVFILQNNS